MATTTTEATTTTTTKGSRKDEWKHYKHNASQFTFREDDTLILAYPKCGTHWANEIIRFLLAGTVDLPMEEKDEAMIEMQPMEHLEALPSPRILNTHAEFKTIAPEFLQFKCKTFYITRDPKDVMVSHYFHHVNSHKSFDDSPVEAGVEEAPQEKKKEEEEKEEKKEEKEKKEEGDDDDDDDEDDRLKTWPEHFNARMNLKGARSWFDYTRSFEKGIEENPDSPILELVYETMKEEPLQEIKRMAAFLELQVSEDFLRTVVEKTSFKSMKKQRVEEKGPLLYMYRKGEKGDWKNYFTVAQMEAFNDKFEADMQGTKAYKRYTHTN